MQAALVDVDAEIIVVDNFSSDDSCEMVKRLFPKVILIENKENFGFSKGNNIGAAQSKSEYLCILNPDTVVAEDTFKKILNYAEKIPKMGILGCQLIDGRGQFLPECKRNIPTPMVSIKKILGFSNTYYVNHLLPSDIGKVDVLVGAFMILKNEVYKKVKGFDEDYFMYGEDVDLSYKVLKAGYENHYYGKTTILHYKGESTLKDKIYAKRFYGAMQIFYSKHFKSNPVFDIMVWFGVWFSRYFMRMPKLTTEKVTYYFLMTNDLDLNIRLPFETRNITDFAEVADYSQVILDGNDMKYSEIIDKMASSDPTKQLTFRILPKNASFIIGSNSSEHRGDVILLEKSNAHMQ